MKEPEHNLITGRKNNHSVKVPRLYKIASSTVKSVKEEGGSFKTLLYSKGIHVKNLKGLYGLILKTLKNEEVINRLIEKSNILVKEEKADPWLIRVLVAELVYGSRNLPGNSKPILTVLKYKDNLLKEAEKENIKFPVTNQKTGHIVRYVRVNTLKLSVADAVKLFKDEGWVLVKAKIIHDYDSFLQRIKDLSENEFMKDLHVKDLLIFPEKTELFGHELYLNGSIILQDKASCLASWLLNPEPGSKTLDLCAAPGMKTTHLAAIMQNQGSIYAVERALPRYQVLQEMVEKCGVTCVNTAHEDALNINAKTCPGVNYILVDPSCSGSGIVDRPSIGYESTNKSRLENLGTFQKKLLKHALINFPDTKRVVYSTCSLNVEENEEVVERALRAVNTLAGTPVFKLADNLLDGKWCNYGSDHYEVGPKCLYAKPKDDMTNGFFIAVFERIDPFSVPRKEKGGKAKKKNRKDTEIHKTLPLKGSKKVGLGSGTDLRDYLNKKRDNSSIQTSNVNRLDNVRSISKRLETFVNDRSESTKKSKKRKFENAEKGNLIDNEEKNEFALSEPVKKRKKKSKETKQFNDSKEWDIEIVQTETGISKSKNKKRNSKEWDIEIVQTETGISKSKNKKKKGNHEDDDFSWN